MSRFFLISNDKIINPSNWTSLLCFQFFSKNLCIAGLRKYFLRMKKRSRRGNVQWTFKRMNRKAGGKARSKRSRPNGGVIVLPLLSLILLLLACNPNKKTEVTKQLNSEEDNTPVVRVQKLTLSKEPIPVEVSGVVKSEKIIDLSFKTGGIIKNIPIRNAQKVKKGQLLASIISTEIDAQLTKTKQVADKAEKDLIRIEKLFKDSATTSTEVDILKTRRDLALSDLLVAQYNKEHTEITAPFSGRILKINAESSEVISSGMPVLQLATANGNDYIFKTFVADRDLIRMELNDKAAIILDAYPKHSLDAYVSKISETANPRTGAFEIELRISALKNLRLRNGFTGKAILYPNEKTDYFKISMNALVEGNNESAYIFLLTDNGNNRNLVKKTKVYPKAIKSDFFIVPKGQLGQEIEIVTEGAAYLKDGLEVIILD